MLAVWITASVPCRGQRRDLVRRAFRIRTLAMVNPYSENTDTAKAVAQAISYDYADLLEKDTGYISARTDVADKNKRCCTSRCMKYMHSPTAMQSISGQMNFMSDIPFYCTISGKAKI